MLALSRKEGERIIIGDPAKPLGTIKVVEIHGDQVRLGLEFPREVEIYREEIAREIAAAVGEASA